MSVVELLELPECMEEVVLVSDQGPVQELVSAGLHPPFHDRVHSRHLDAGEDDLDPRVFEDVIEQSGELSIPVSDHEPYPAACILEVHDQVLRLLGYPGGGRVCGGAEDPDAAAAAAAWVGFQQVRSGANGRGSSTYRHGLAAITRVRTAWLSALEKVAPIR
ncbi:hypothetical protein [Streptomyces sp. ME19-01-6]|uniref:hypothetical protein n=1 Tax=Streptomyces sp. ME19-01-6 TaxID=3028686 RepID=UPI0029B2247D|nr:hypothetical protein [Streptomyces sp. ME19-01-6]MDX3230470.1 hypothetical protein [Streptomyces sp. ME19-01-6]